MEPPQTVASALRDDGDGRNQQEAQNLSGGGDRGRKVKESYYPFSNTSRAWLIRAAR